MKNKLKEVKTRAEKNLYFSISAYMLSAYHAYMLCYESRSCAWKSSYHWHPSESETGNTHTRYGRHVLVYTYADQWCKMQDVIRESRTRCFHMCAWLSLLEAPCSEPWITADKVWHDMSSLSTAARGQYLSGSYKRYKL